MDRFGQLGRHASLVCLCHGVLNQAQHTHLMWFACTFWDAVDRPVLSFLCNVLYMCTA